MKRRRLSRLVALALTAALLLSGCWSRREIQELGFVLTMGVDWNLETEQYDVIFQLARPGEVPSPSGGGGGGGGDVVKSAFFVQVSGPSIAHVVRELRHRKSRHIFFGHMQALVVGQEAARRGVGSILDFVWRYHEVRPTTDILVARGSAREVVAARPALEYLPGRGLPHLMERASSHSTAPRVPLSRLMYAMLQSGRAAGLPVVELMETGTPDPRAAATFLDPAVVGMGIFDLDRLVRVLDRTESRGVMWAMGEVRQTTLTFTDPDRGEETFAVRIRKAGRNIRLTHQGAGLPRVHLFVTAVGDFLQGERIPKKLSPEMIEKVERLTEQQIRESVQAAITVTKAAGSDVIGFGELLRRSAPAVWQRAEQDWDEVYPRLPITVEVRVEIKRTGLLR